MFCPCFISYTDMYFYSLCHVFLLKQRCINILTFQFLRKFSKSVVWNTDSSRREAPPPARLHLFKNFQPEFPTFLPSPVSSLLEGLIHLKSIFQLGFAPANSCLLFTLRATCRALDCVCVFVHSSNCS